MRLDLREFVMAASRELVGFHAEERRALEELAEDRSTTFQDLMDEAVRNLLKKARQIY
jgi:hypothetical protein